MSLTMLSFLFTLLSIINVTFSSMLHCSHEEAAALLHFKTTFSIDHDLQNIRSSVYDCGSNARPRTESWKEGIDCCSWDGVRCDNLTGHVIDLDLGCSKLSGSFPSNNTLFLLKSLKSLNLSYNDFKGSKIPSEIGQFSNLKFLDLSYSGYSGLVPREISHLSKLVSLDLSYNQLTVETFTLRNLVQNLSQVREFVLSGISMSSIDPRIFMNLSTSLTTLRLREVDLRGNFPIFHFPNLKWLSLSGRSSLPSVLTTDLPSSNWSSNLKYMYLSDLQRIVGYPESIGNLKSLELLVLVNCNLEGSIPSSLLNLPKLSVLDLARNHLSELSPGKILFEICHNGKLQILDLSHNNFDGEIPNCLFKLSKSLSVLNLQANNFQGKLPSTFPKGCQLQNLNLHENQIKGPLPRSLVNCVMLEVLDVGNNNINDTFPTWLEYLSELQVLVLRSNNFYGTVSSNNTEKKSTFLKLRILDLSGNDFSGSLPLPYIENFEAMTDTRANVNSSSSYMKQVYYGYQFSTVVTLKGQNVEMGSILTIFTSIDLSNNKFVGEIPDSIGRLHSLKGLNLSHNNLGGHITRSIRDLTNLESLDLSCNELVGEIPVELLSLTQLEVLNLSNNHLVGRIPQSNQFNTFGNDSYQGNIRLCGTPISKTCIGDGTTEQPPASPQEKDEFWEFISWRVVGLGYGCGTIFGLLMGYLMFKIGKPKWFVSLVDLYPYLKGRMMNRARKRRIQRRN